MTVIRELVTLIGFDVQEEKIEVAERGFESLKTGALAVGAAVAAAGAGIVAMVASTARAGRETAIVSEQLGLSAAALQELEFAAESTGAEVEDVRDLLKEMGAKAAEAANGEEAAATEFRKLGIQVRDANGRLKSSSDLLAEASEGFAQIEDAGEKSRIAMALFGDAGARLLPLMNRGAAGVEALRAEARSLGLVMEEDTTRGAEQLINSFGRIAATVQGLAKRFGSQLFPAFQRVLDATGDYLRANRELLLRGIDALADGISSLIDGLMSLARFVSENRRVIGIFAGLLSVALIPQIVAATQAFGALFIAQVKALAIPALAAAAFIGLAAAIALVIEDIFVFVSGGQSAIGDIIKAFTSNPVSEDDHWMVRTLAFIVLTLGSAIKAVDAFFRGFFEEAEELGGITEALASAWDTTIEFWKKTFSDFFGFLADSVESAFRGILDRGRAFIGQFSSLPIIGRFIGEGATAEAATAAAASSPIPTVSAAGRSASDRAIVNNSVSRGPISITVAAPLSGTPEAAGQTMAAELEQVLARDRREISRQLDAGARGVR